MNKMTMRLFVNFGWLLTASVPVTGFGPLPIRSFLATGGPVGTGERSTTGHFTTAFEADYYGDDNTSNPYLDDTSRIAVDKDTKLVLGLNKYSHDTSICAADARTGKVLFGMAKERLTRKKHDAGNTASLVDKCLDCLELDYTAIKKVIVNNHHHRVLPMEQSRPHMEWECGLGINGGVEDGYDDEENLLDDVEKVSGIQHRPGMIRMWVRLVRLCDSLNTTNVFFSSHCGQHEISHHLAHAYSAATQSPFDTGMVVVMDGMGETYRTMLHAKQTGDSSYTSDLSFGSDSFECVPADLHERAMTSVFDWREAESVYVFTKEGSTMDLKVQCTMFWFPYNQQ